MLVGLCTTCYWCPLRAGSGGFTSGSSAPKSFAPWEEAIGRERSHLLLPGWQAVRSVPAPVPEARSSRPRCPPWCAEHGMQSERRWEPGAVGGIGVSGALSQVLSLSCVCQPPLPPTHRQVHEAGRVSCLSSQGFVLWISGYLFVLKGSFLLGSRKTDFLASG